MIFDLTGVLEDGTPLRPGVPENTRAHLKIPLGADVTIRVRVIYPSGAPVDLNLEGTGMLLTVKRRPNEDPPRIVKGAAIAQGIGIFTLQPGDMYSLTPGLYGYDVWLTIDGKREPIIPLSPLTFLTAAAQVPWSPPPPTINLVENDTDPLILDFSGIDINGYTITVHIGYETTPLVRTAVLTDPGNGIAEVQWLAGDLQPGVFTGEIQAIKPDLTVKTSDLFVFDIRPEVA